MDDREQELAGNALSGIFLEVGQVLSHLRIVVDFAEQHCYTKRLNPGNGGSNLVLEEVLFITNKNLAQELDGAYTHWGKIQLT